MERRPISLVVVTSLMFATSALCAAEIWVEFDHAQEQSETKTISPQPGDAVSVKILNTCPSFFAYQTTVLKQGTDAPDAAAGISATCSNENVKKAWLKKRGVCVMTEKIVNFTHAADTDGYQVQIRKTDRSLEEIQGITTEMLGDMPSDKPCTIPAKWSDSATPKKHRPTTLPDRFYTFSVRRTPWALGMSGGFTVSSVTDPVFAVANDPNSTTMPPATVVTRNDGADDSSALGFGGFVHFHHRNWEIFDIGLAPTFGLGVADENSLSVFAGFSFAAGDIGYVNVGWNWREIDRLPAGQELGAAPINENVLIDLPKRVDDGFFIGFSFKFMSPGESFFKKNITTEHDADTS